jgi:serine-type D-Ala-D-Ala carboxypeptidase (penicillin-binding protein 5/6)
MSRTVLQGGRRRRHWGRPPRRRRRWPRALAALILLTLVAVGVFAFVSDGGAGRPGGRSTAATGHRAPPAPRAAAPAPRRSQRSTYGRVAAPASERVSMRFKHEPRSAILFDVRTGRVLWSHRPGVRAPIASLTKMMTSVLVADRAGPSEPVRITKEVLGYSGSGMGVLPKNKRVPVETLLYGLLLPSGNDAAIALALHVSGTQRRFVALMNAQTRKLGLGCSHFSSPSGIVDARNYSCTSDLAVLTRAMLRRPRLARIIRTRNVALPLPVKGGKVYLYNNNPLLVQRYPGTDGVKTGFTDAAGRCLVSTVRRGKAHLGVIMLDSVDPPGQSKRLFEAGFRALRRPHA